MNTIGGIQSAHDGSSTERPINLNTVTVAALLLHIRVFMIRGKVQVWFTRANLKMQCNLRTQP